MTLQGSPSITWGQRPSQLREEAGGEGKRAEKDQKAFDGGYLPAPKNLQIGASLEFESPSFLR